MQALTRGIIANWLVNLAIWLATSSSSVPGKIIGAIVPVTAFTAMGMEHSVANMSLIPLGLALAGRTYQQFWLNNLLPVVIGNIIGGAVCMGLALSWVHGKRSAGLSSLPVPEPVGAACQGAGPCMHVWLPTCGRYAALGTCALYCLDLLLLRRGR